MNTIPNNTSDNTQSNPQPNTPDTTSAAPESKPAPPPQRPRSSRRKRSRWWRRLRRLNPVVLLVAVFLVLLGVAASIWLPGLFSSTSDLPPDRDGDDAIYYQYGNQSVRIHEDVAVNTFAASQFSEDASGAILFSGKHATYGIDVSNHQKDIDWAAVARDGIDFAMIRVGYRGYSVGNVMPDERFVQNIQGALENGIDVGIYFFSQAISPEEAREEAAFVLEAIQDYEITYPVVFDWELVQESDARSKQVDSDTLNACALAFCEEIQAGGYRPAIYFYQNLAYFTYDVSVIDQYDFWLAEYDSYPDFYYGFQMWQYTSSGAVAGIEGDVDRNISFTDYSRTIRRALRER